MDKQVSILIVDDNEKFVNTTKRELSVDNRLFLLGHAKCKESAIKMSCELNPDVVIMDINLINNKDREGIPTAKEIRFKTCSKIVFLTSSDDDETMRLAHMAFPSAYVQKSQLSDTMNLLAETVYNAAIFDTPDKRNIKLLIENKLAPAEVYALNCIISNDRSELIKLNIDRQKPSLYKKLGLGDREIDMAKYKTIHKNKAELVRHIYNNW